MDVISVILTGTLGKVYVDDEIMQSNNHGDKSLNYLDVAKV